MQLVAVWVAVTHVQTLYSAFLSLSRTKIRARTHTRMHTRGVSLALSLPPTLYYISLT